MKKISVKEQAQALYSAARDERRRYRYIDDPDRTKDKVLRPTKGWMYRSDARTDASKKTHQLMLGEKNKPPSCFCLDKNCEEVFGFLDRLRQPILRNFNSVRQIRSRRFGSRPKRSYVDFTEIQDISPAAALVLAAEFDRIRKLTRTDMYTIDLEEWHPRVRKALIDLGFMNLLGVSGKEYEQYKSSKSPLRMLPFVSGVKADTEKANPLLDSIEELIKPLEEETSLSLFDGLSEAMTNVSHHAYKGTKYKYRTLKDRWWLTGSYNEDNGRLNITFFDQGITIPVRLPRSKKGHLAARFLKSAYKIIRINKATDAQCIQAAIQPGKSTEDDEWRGKGLAQMKEFIDKSSDGRLRIISRKGELVYTKAHGEKLTNYGYSIGGTLIEWEISI